MYSKKTPYYLLLSIIVLLSFFLYSSRYYPLLNSDDALNVLMAHYYKLPDDFYCWGQDRGGTLIPLISQLFIKLFHCSALVAVSLSNYLLLILGYWGLSSLIKSKYYKIILAVIWFLPVQRYIDLLRFPIGVQYSLLGFSLFLITLLEKKAASKWVVKHLLLLSITMVLSTTVWVSDLSMVPIAVLLGTLALFHILKHKNLRFDKAILPYFFIGTTACYLFVRYAKSFATTKTAHYLSINGFHELKNAMLLLWEALCKDLTFRRDDSGVSLYFFWPLLWVFAFAFFIVKKRLPVHLFSNKWSAFFLADAVVVFAAMLASSWVLANGMGRWYFVATYISFSMFVLLTLDKAEKRCPKTLRYSVLVLAVLGAITPIYTMKYVEPKTLRPMADIVGEFTQLGEVGIIADFWNSYITSCPDPEHIKATPCDECGVRSQEIVDMVFEKDNIYVIRDMWMDHFPDTLQQFGHVLLKEGEPFNMGNCNVCKYGKAKITKTSSN